VPHVIKRKAKIKLKNIRKAFKKKKEAPNA
jgi:hypothetical protein